MSVPQIVFFGSQVSGGVVPHLIPLLGQTAPMPPALMFFQPADFGVHGPPAGAAFSPWNSWRPHSLKEPSQNGSGV